MSSARRAPGHFEVGPIRPPNEASSLLVRVTRNCPFNRCAFCPVYKGTPFSLRGVGEINADIDSMVAVAGRIAELARARGGLDESLLGAIVALPGGAGALQVARFIEAGGRTAFLQDANSLIMPVEGLVEVLAHLRAAFPGLRRVTSYARAHTVSQRSLADLERVRRAGLDRLHLGLESGADAVLALMGKGASAARHIEAGQRVRAAGIELTEYVMPGLGGRARSEEHARETARALRAIQPHHLRLRSLTIPPGSPLARLVADGAFEPIGDIAMVRELRLLLAGLEGVTTTVRSDHVLNLLEEISGRLPEDLDRLLGVIDRFLGLELGEQELFVVGRRMGVLRRLDDLDDPPERARAEAALRRFREHFSGPLDAAVRELTTRFV
jgi:hypothetical protein